MQDEFRCALEKALKKLHRSERFESEVRACLAAFEPSVIDEVVAYLSKHRLLSETRAAEQALTLRSGKRAVGRERLQAELERRGATSTIIEGVLPDADEERARLRELIRCKFEPTADRAKAGRFLLSRGFAEEDVESELSAYMGDLD
jgi:SOS response regulatory protein OraA/RecX